MFWCTVGVGWMGLTCQSCGTLVGECATRSGFWVVPPGVEVLRVGGLVACISVGTQVLVWGVMLLVPGLGLLSDVF